MQALFFFKRFMKLALEKKSATFDFNSFILQGTRAFSGKPGI